MVQQVHTQKSMYVAYSLRPRFNL